MHKISLLRHFANLTAHQTRLRTELLKVDAQLRVVRKQLEEALGEEGEEAEEGEHFAPAMHEAPKRAETQPGIQAVVDLVRSLARPVGIKEAAEKLGTTYAGARLRLNRAARLGLLQRADKQRGYYEIKPPASGNLP